jgi:hypothetical protein
LWQSVSLRGTLSSDLQLLAWKNVNMTMPRLDEGPTAQ